jgi:transcriptional regulator with XRE-family HTH domain
MQAAFAMKVSINPSIAVTMSHLERKLLVAERIRQLRENSGLSQRDVAKALHIGQATYHRMEKGQSEPSAVQIATLSGLYGETFLWLLGLPNFIVKAY